MQSEKKIRTIKSMVDEINFQGRSLLSINDLTNKQIYGLFELARKLEPWNRSAVNLVPGNIMATLFFQPSTRTRMSFETAMHRLGGAVVTESTPLISSSVAKEESLSDMLKVVSKYANIIVIRHPDDVQARDAATYSESPIINGGFGDWEHPTQALLDLYTLWRVHDRIEGLDVCIASPDLVAARTGHSMAYGLVRLGANVTLASPKKNRMPEEFTGRLREFGGYLHEEFDLNQESFNKLVSKMNLVYLPGCSAPKGDESEAFKKIMEDYYIKSETLEDTYREKNRIVYVTHTLPRRQGEMDTRIDKSPYQLYFEAIGYSVSIRMALVLAILGL